MNLSKIYLIGTFSNWHRTYNATRDLKKHFPGVDIQVCAAVDRNTIRVKDDIAYSDGNHVGNMTKIPLLCGVMEGNFGRLACSMSHTNVIIDAYENGHKYILVAEDDLLLWRNAKKIFQESLWSAPEDWELLRLSWYPSPKINVKDITDYRYSGNGIRWTELYLLNRIWIEKLYKHLLEWSRCSFDLQLHKLIKINQYIIKYSLGIQWNNYENDVPAGEKNKATTQHNKWWYTIPGKKFYLTI